MGNFAGIIFLDENVVNDSIPWVNFIGEIIESGLYLRRYIS